MGSSVSVGIGTKFIPYKENAMTRIVALLVIVLTMLVSMTSVVSAATTGILPVAGDLGFPRRVVWLHSCAAFRMRRARAWCTGTWISLAAVWSQPACLRM